MIRIRLEAVHELLNVLMIEIPKKASGDSFQVLIRFQALDSETFAEISQMRNGEQASAL